MYFLYLKFKPECDLFIKLNTASGKLGTENNIIVR